MELFRFIAWQWNRSFTEERVAFMLLVVLSIYVPTALYLGMLLGYVLISSLVIALLTAVMYALCEAIAKRWAMYKRAKEREAQEIVDRLRGSRNGVGTNC
jgi:uncharacterized membrane protein